MGRRLLVGVLLGVLVIAGMGMYADGRALLTSLQGFAWGMLGPVLLLTLLNYALRFAKWHYYLRVLGAAVRPSDSAIVFLSGFSMAVTPGKFGELLKALLLKERAEVPPTDTASVVVAERLTDFIALIFLAAGGALSTQHGLGVMAISIVGSVTLLAALSSQKLSLTIIRWIGRLPRGEQIAPKLEALYHAMAQLIRPAPLIGTTLLSVLAWGCECIGFYLVLQGLMDTVPDLATATFIYSFATIFGAVTMLPGGLGVTEGSLIGLSLRFGVAGTTQAATAAALLIRFCTLWFAVIVGLFALDFHRGGSIVRRLTKGMTFLAIVWCTLAVLLTGGHGFEGLRIVGALLFLTGMIAAYRRLSGPTRTLTLLSTFLAVLVFWGANSPTNDRDWSPDQARLSWAEVSEDQVTIHNIRDFRYRSTTDWDERWYDASFDLDDLVGASFVVEPFSQFEGAAHTMVSFEFRENRFLVLSVEIRKEKEENFSVLGGLFRQYELQYVAGDERDLIQLRTNHRKDRVYLHPIQSSHDDLRKYLVSMLARMNSLRDQPEFYNALTSSCTTNLVDHLNQILTEPVGWDYRVILPGYSGELAYELDLIDTDLSFPDTQARDLINDRAETYQNREDFSLGIRGRTDAVPALH